MFSICFAIPILKIAMRKFVILSCLLACTIFVSANNFPRSVQKKIDKTLVKLFPNTVVELKDMLVSEEVLSSYTSVKDVKISVLKSAENQLGYACFASSKGKNDYFDYMVIFDNELIIKKVIVLVYRSTYGGEIMSRSWLKQFIGKSKGQAMEIDKDIDSISGATLSAPSLAKGVRDLSLLIAKLNVSEI